MKGPLFRGNDEKILVLHESNYIKSSRGRWIKAIRQKSQCLQSRRWLWKQQSKNEEKNKHLIRVNETRVKVGVRTTKNNSRDSKMRWNKESNNDFCTRFRRWFESKISSHFRVLRSLWLPPSSVFVQYISYVGINEVWKHTHIFSFCLIFGGIS